MATVFVNSSIPPPTDNSTAKLCGWINQHVVAPINAIKTKKVRVASATRQCALITGIFLFPHFSKQAGNLCIKIYRLFYIPKENKEMFL